MHILDFMNQVTDKVASDATAAPVTLTNLSEKLGALAARATLV